jgi:transcriptional regulator with XRE-family HTH domain
MSCASELLQKLEYEGMTRKQMAAYTGTSYQQTCRYVNGECNVPTEFLNLLYRATKDARLIELITLGTKTVMLTSVDEHPPVDDIHFMTSVMEQRKKELQAELHLLEILADGRIDRRDKLAIEQYDKVFHESIQHNYVIHEAVMAAYRKSCGESK